MRRILFLVLTTVWLGLLAAVRGGDWLQWGGTATRNMVSTEKNLPDLRPPAGQTAMHLSEAGCPLVKWKVHIGSTTWGNPTAADGRVFVGTAGHDQKGGLLKCFAAATGHLLWELDAPPRHFLVPERPADYAKRSPWDLLVTTHAQTHGWGICSSTTIDGPLAYVLTQRGEVVGFDVRGGSGTAPKVLWTFDLWTEVKTRPADTFSNAALIHGDVLYISTCNGIDRWPQWYGRPAAPPNPAAPNLVALDKRTGRLLATDDAPIGRSLLHGQWSPPSLGNVGGHTLIYYGGGDGVCYAFEALREIPATPVKLKTVWSYDCNPPEYKGIGAENYSLGDKDVVRDVLGDSKAVAAEKARHLDRDGRLLSMSEIVGSPAFHNGRVYVAIGRDPRHGPGRGALHCIDASLTGDISRTGRVWCYDTIDRSLATPSVADGLVYIADITGRLHCLDADTGSCCWTHDTNHETWGSTLVADGKVYLVTRRSLHVLAAGKEKKPLSEIRLGGECSPIAANGTLYVVLRGTLYALQAAAMRPVAGERRSDTFPSSASRLRQEAIGAGDEASSASDGRQWPGWRGPQGNGFSPEVPERLPPKKLLWSRTMSGQCHAPISVAEGCVLVADHDGKRDYWRCFDARDGRLRWTHDYANAEKMEFGAAPRAAPLLAAGKAYCLSAWGDLMCLDLADGHVTWQKRLSQRKTPTWGYCVSPQIADRKLIASPGEDGPVTALDPRSGNILWTGTGKGMNYASLLVGTLGGVRQVVGYDAATAGGWELATGRRLWTVAIDATAGYVVPSPVAVGQGVLLASDQENARLFQFAAGGLIVPQPAATSEDLAPEIATPTAWGDAILGASPGLVLLDASATGGKPLHTLWICDKEKAASGVCHAIVSRDHALVQCEDGHVLLLAADRKICRIVDRQKLCGKTWVHPALADGLLYLRDQDTLYCYDMRRQ